MHGVISFLNYMLKVLTLCFYILVPFLRCSTGAAVFKKHPPSVLYVQTGQTARFVWNYTVGNRNKEFRLNSPLWAFYDSNSTRSIIGTEDGLNKWEWALHSECPARLKTRVSKESTATLVISNVTTADNGTYGCSLVLNGLPDKASKVQLIVTVSPQFSQKPPLTKNIAEGQDLSLPCAAIGPPTPNITWVQIVGDNRGIKSTGTGSATLSIEKIKRDESGTYECQAMNNPNENQPVTAQTVVTVYYPPKINEEETTDQSGCINSPVKLFCKADGSPEPNITWTNQNGKELKSKTHGLNLSYTFTVHHTSEFGNYTCKVVNDLGNDSRVISLQIGKCPPLVFTESPISGGVPAGIIAGVVIAGILAIAGLVIALVFCYRRKSLRDPEHTRSYGRDEQRVQMSSLPDQEQQYARVQRNSKPTTTTDPQLPQYAAVNKANKKKKPEPGEILYADLAHDFEENEEPRPPSNRHPSNETSTVYADIAGSRQMQPAPQYGNLNRDVKDLYI